MAQVTRITPDTAHPSNPLNFHKTLTREPRAATDVTWPSNGSITVAGNHRLSAHASSQRSNIVNLWRRTTVE
ncbi:hypothetical protein TNCV_1910821 [Trichonephila clavipes]|nr:hypothetical protein TNCV_1910821 [Trichonephila clavipes]